MNQKKYLLQQLAKCRRKMNAARLLDALAIFSAAFGVAGIGVEFVSIFVPFYYANLAAACCFLAGALAGTVYAFLKRADMRAAARRLDSFGLKERMLTACELMDREDMLAARQREDAVRHYDAIRERIRLPLMPDWRHLLALALSAGLALGLAFVPSSAREEAKVRHKVQMQAKAEEEKLEELLDALQNVDADSLSEEQREQLNELIDAMELSKEELASAGSQEELAAAMQRLDYKYEQAGQGLEQLAGLLSDPEGVGVTSAEALAKALANSGEQMASSGTGTASGSGTASDGDGGDGSGNGDGSGENGSGENGDGSDGSGNGSGSGSGDGSGSGSGSGNGDGSGDGSGNGSGGSGDGNGSGRGTGSSSAEHDYVSVPNEVGDDPSVTGNKTKDTDSDYYRQQNGLAWEGEHVDYSSVVGQYTEDAYEGIESGKYPSGMESVIRDYFESLNE